MRRRRSQRAPELVEQPADVGRPVPRAVGGTGGSHRGARAAVRAARRAKPAGERALHDRDRLVELPGAGEPECFGHAGDSVVVHGKAPSGCVTGRRTGRPCRVGLPGRRIGRRAVAQVVRGARAALTAAGARKAPRTSTDGDRGQGQLGLTSSAIVASPRTRSSIGLPRVPQSLEVAAAEVLRAERQRPAGDRVVHRGRPALELAPDRRADEVRAVGVEALVDEQIDLAEVDQPQVDGDLLAAPPPVTRALVAPETLGVLARNAASNTAASLTEIARASRSVWTRRGGHAGHPLDLAARGAPGGGAA